MNIIEKICEHEVIACFRDGPVKGLEFPIDYPLHTYEFVMPIQKQKVFYRRYNYRFFDKWCLVGYKFDQSMKMN